MAPPACLHAHSLSALQALKKDEGVPWTGMLAIVHSYVTHKTGRAPRAGRKRTFFPLSSPAPQLDPSEAVLGHSSGKRDTLVLVLCAGQSLWEGGILGPGHPGQGPGSCRKV